MSDEDPTVSSNPGFAPRPAPVKVPLVVLGFVGVAFAVWLGVRIKGAVGNKEVMARAQATTVERTRAEASLPPEVEIVRGQPAKWEPVVTFEGTLSAQQSADLGFKTPGRLANIKVKVGDRVRAGTLLATLTGDEASAQLAAAQAQLGAAEAQAALAADAAKRTALVVSSGAQSEAVGVQADKQKQLAEAQVEAAKAQLTLARTAVANHRLTAPFAGTVTRAPNAPGAVVAPGVPLFHVANLDTLKLVGTVGAEDASLVRVGAPVDLLGLDGSTVMGKGKVTALVPSLDPTTKRVPVEASIANDGKQPLLAGALVRANVRGGEPITVLAYPHTALRPGSQNELLVVKGGKLSVRRIEHVVAADGSLLVRAGVSAEDDVVARPWPEAAEGQPVRLAKAKPEGKTTTAARPAP